MRSHTISTLFNLLPILLLALFLPPKSSSELIGKDVRLWWFVIKREYWKDAKFKKQLIMELGHCNHEKHSGFIGADAYVSPHLGTPFIVFKTAMNPQCNLATMGKVYKKFKKQLAGWGEVPYSAKQMINANPNPPKKKANKKTEEKPKKNSPKKPAVKRGSDPKLEDVPTTAVDPLKRWLSRTANATMYMRPDGPGFNLFGDLVEERDEVKELNTNERTSFYGNYTSKPTRRDALEYDDHQPGSWGRYPITVRREAWQERRKLCQPPSMPMKALGNRYYYRSEREKALGAGVNIYIIGTGLDLKHDPAETPTDIKSYHGTGIYSLIAFPRIGQAPKAKVTFVQHYNIHGYYTTAHLFNAMFKTYDSILSSGTREAIIYCPWFYDQVQPENDLFANVYEPPDQVLGTNALKPGEYLSPTSEAEQYPHVVIPVGASDHENQKMFDDRPGKTVRIRAWAPGEAVHVMAYDVHGREGYTPVSGVAFAGATIVGMLAAFLSEGVKFEKVVEHLSKLSWPRVKGGPNIVWNGVKETEWTKGPHGFS
ncbi:hypothetical protein TWF481_006033 [Arthrobotrys musiformis]|uniref:Peptidase S8/S53 domain-containing protein n=1 Tax=Arthrobotrys musiformis TaxID=47236 RepID=A0AAV9WG38_9PEZI